VRSHVADCDACDLELHATSRCNRGRLLGDEVDERRANRSVTEHANTNALRRHGIHAIG
jgi:hypothetical protein